MKKPLKKLWNLLTSVLVALAVLLALLLAGGRLIGLQVYTVLSGSMEPTYHVGSVIYVKSVDYTALKAGDVITFMLDEDTIATHRIVAVVPDEEDETVLRYRTKGDANESEDGSLVHYKNVIGTPVFTIPLLGYVANYIQNPPGTYIAIAAGAILLLLMFLPDLFPDEEKEKKKAAPRRAEAPEPEKGRAAPRRDEPSEAVRSGEDERRSERALPTSAKRGKTKSARTKPYKGRH